MNSHKRGGMYLRGVDEVVGMHHRVVKTPHKIKRGVAGMESQQAAKGVGAVF